MANTFLERANSSSLVFDAVTRSNESRRARVTKHSVETGFKISDNISINNLVLTLEGVVSDASLSVPADGRGVKGLKVKVSDFSLKVLGVDITNRVPDNVFTNNIFNRTEPPKVILGTESAAPASEDARYFLTGVFDEKELVTLVTQDGEFDNLVMTSLSFAKSKPERNVLNFSITLEQLRVVTTSTAVVPQEQVSEKFKEEAQGESKTGAVETKKAPINRSQLAERFNIGVVREEALGGP